MSGGGELDATIGNGSGVIELTSISGRLVAGAPKRCCEALNRPPQN
jgi:hypothetical protein